MNAKRKPITPSEKKIKTAVVGVGYLGSYHAEKYASLNHAELVAVCDIDEHRCHEKAKQLHVETIIDYQSLVGKVNAVSIAVPTPLHHKIAAFFLNHGIHVLLEKPIATTIEEADDLIAIAAKHKAILQVGHLERFNNALKAIAPMVQNPRLIESTRLANFQLRGSDVSVVLDLMIHDIDIIQWIVQSDIQHISASGAQVLSPHIDLANARIEFTNGCVANVTANRISLKKKRELNIFQIDRYIAVDLDRKKIAVQQKGNKEMFPGVPEITRQVTRFHTGDALQDQIAAFLDAILHNTPPLVSGEDGKRALATALEITLIVRRTNEQYF